MVAKDKPTNWPRDVARSVQGGSWTHFGVEYKRRVVEFYNLVSLTIYFRNPIIV